MFSVSVDEEVANIDKDDNESVVTIRFIDSARFMANS